MLQGGKTLHHGGLNRRDTVEAHPSLMFYFGDQDRNKRGLVTDVSKVFVSFGLQILQESQTGDDVGGQTGYQSAFHIPGKFKKHRDSW